MAYADFVTAMMAFFIVMWILSQDQKVREEVAHYFKAPSVFFKDPVGASTRPDRTGALFNQPSSGSVPDEEAVSA